MGFSLAHLLVLLFVWAIWIVPLYRILGKVGWSRGWAFVGLFPPAAIIVLWCIAFGEWKAVKPDYKEVF